MPIIARLGPPGNARSTAGFIQQRMRFVEIVNPFLMVANVPTKRIIVVLFSFVQEQFIKGIALTDING